MVKEFENPEANKWNNEDRNWQDYLLPVNI